MQQLAHTKYAAWLLLYSVRFEHMGGFTSLSNLIDGRGMAFVPTARLKLRKLEGENEVCSVESFGASEKYFLWVKHNQGLMSHFGF